MDDLGSLGRNSYSNDINNIGQIAGYYRGAEDNLPHPFVYTDVAGMMDLESLTDVPAGWGMQRAVAINDSGWIVGQGSYNSQYRSFVLVPVPEGQPRL